MLTKNFQIVVGKAMVCSDFRKQLMEDPEKAVSSYDLSEEELAEIKALTEEKIELYAPEIDENIKRDIYSRIR